MSKKSLRVAEVFVLDIHYLRISKEESINLKFQIVNIRDATFSRSISCSRYSLSEKSPLVAKSISENSHLGDRVLVVDIQFLRSRCESLS